MPKLMDTNIFSDVWQRCQTGGRVGGGARGGTPSSRLFPPFIQFLCFFRTLHEGGEAKEWKEQDWKEEEWEEEEEEEWEEEEEEEWEEEEEEENEEERWPRHRLSS